MQVLSKLWLKAKGEQRDDLEAALETVMAKAAEDWPGIVLAAEQFIPHLARHVQSATFESRQTSDLYAACACAAGNSAAIAAVQRRLNPALQRVSERLRLGDDALSTTWTRLLVADEQKEPRIAAYSGEGRLSGWIQVSLVRVSIDAKRHVQRERPAEDSDFADLASRDPELEFLEQRYRQDFARAFRAAVLSLSAEARNVLRFHYRDRLTVSQIGEVLGVHRSSAARRIAEARTEILDHTRKNLSATLAVPITDVDSLVRLLAGNLDASLSSILA